MTILGYLFGLPYEFFELSYVPCEAAQEPSVSQAAQQVPAGATAPLPTR